MSMQAGRTRLATWLDSANTAVAWSLLCLALLLAISRWVPLAPYMPAGSLDPSWIAGMNQAVVQGLRFGSEIIFTYGPYSAVSTRAYHPLLDTRTLVTAGILVVCLCSVLVLLARRRMPPIWLLATSVVFLPVLQVDALLLTYPLVFLCWWVMHGCSSPVTSRWALPALAVLTLPLGILPLIKGSLWVMCLIVMLVCAGMAAHRRNASGLCVIVTGPLIAASAGWLLSGQAMADLPQYFLRMLPIISGYTDAMSVSGSRREIAVYLLAAVPLLVLVLLVGSNPWPVRVVLVAGFGAFVLLCFKGGFTRHDMHAVWAGSGLVIAAMVLVLAERRPSTVMAFMLCVACGAAILNNHRPLTAQALASDAWMTLRDAGRGAWSRLSQPQQLPRQYEDLQQAIRNTDPLPRLSGTVDIYSFDQYSLIASGNRWSPRPILQSYSVYTDELAETNRRHLLGPRAPDHLIFRLQPIDGRLPGLEDGPSWIEFLRWYDLAPSNGKFLLLSRRQAEFALQQAPGTRLTAQLGQSVSLPPHDGLTFARIMVKPTLQGRLLRLFFKPSRLEIQLVLASGETRSFRFIPRMASGGFLLSPLVTSDADVASLFGASRWPAEQGIRSLRISPVDRTGDWSDAFEIETSLVGPRIKPVDSTR